MAQSATSPIRCFSPLGLPIMARFDGPRLTSDGALAWLAEADAALGLCAALARAFPDWRTGPVQHSLELLIRQRVFQLACGYEDQNDAATVRHDPLLMRSPSVLESVDDSFSGYGGHGRDGSESLTSSG